MFKIFFLKELGTALRRPMVYIFFVVVALLVFLATVSDSVSIGGAIGNVNRNSPYVITNFVSLLSLFGLLIAAAFFNNAALRDYNTNFNEIIFSTPLQKSGYFFGRFFGALILASIPLLGVFFGVWLGSVMGPAFGWVDAEDIGPFYAATFINNFFLFILPNMFLAGSITYLLANRWKSTVVSFIGVILVIVGYIISNTILSDVNNETIAAMSDPFGTTAYSVTTRYFTPADRNTISPEFTGVLLQNRLLYMAISVTILLVSYFSFSFKDKQRARRVKTKPVEALPNFSLPKLHQSFDGTTSWAQFKSFFKVDFVSIIRSTTFRILFFFMFLLTLSDLTAGFEYFGLQSYPITYKLVDDIANNSAIFVLIVLVFFSGELVWRDRENKISEVIDSSAFRSLPSLLAKTLALFSVAFFLYVFGVIMAVVYQLMNGYAQIELDVYFGSFFYQYLALYATTCAVLVFLQVFINNKYLAYFASVLFLILDDLFFALLEINSNLVGVASTPTMIYSDMNGFGPAAESVLWFNSYWVLLGLLLLFLSGLFVKRGKINGRRERIAVAKKNLTRPYAIRFTAIFVVWLAVGGFIFYNVHVLNEVPSNDTLELQAANYEKQYKKYESLPQPKMLAAKYGIDIFPYQRDVKAKIEALLINDTNASIDSVHFTVQDGWNQKVEITGATLAFNDEELGYQIFKLADPMQPGDTLEINLTAEYITRGFENEVSNSSVIRNGTFFNNGSLLPSIGYASGLELSDNDTREEYGLPDKDRLPRLKADCGPECESNYLSQGVSDWVTVETVISTASDQVAVASGSLVRQWQENGRNYYHYVVDHPSQNFYSFISARYEVARRKWNGVDMEVYYDAKHDYNIEKMLDAIEKSLKYYTENFGPYYHKQARIIEFPRYATFAQAFPGTMPYSESFGFVINLEDESENNVVDAVIAHEMAHQWWAHQEISAHMQGGTMLVESLAEYSSLMVMKQDSDPLKMKNFLRYDLDRYLGGRTRETVKELPLYKVENQSYIHYGKGSMVLYALQDYVGEDTVNAVLRDFLDEFKYSTPYPTSLDFLEYLEPRVPDSLNYLITDWFKEITLYDHRLKDAVVENLDNGKYRVTMDIETYKIKADTIGNEQRVPINDWIDVGLYADSDEQELIFEKRVKFDSNELKLTFEVDQMPVLAAIDPRRVLIERIYSDNVKRVEEEE